MDVPPPIYRPWYPDPALGLPLASWWRRFGGAVLDSLVISFASAVVVIPAYFLLVASLIFSSTTGRVDSSSFVVHFLAFFAFEFVVNFLIKSFYFGFTDGRGTGQSLGKMVVGIAVRDATTASVIGFWRGFGRGAFDQALSITGILYLIGYLAPLWDPRRQSWTDRVIDTIVIEVR